MASSKEFLENLSGSDVEFENLDEESDVSSDDSELLSPRKKIARRLSSSESELEDNELNRDEWTPQDKLMSLEPFLGSTGVQKIPSDPSSISECVGLFIKDDLFVMMAEQSNLYYAQSKHKYQCSSKSKKMTFITSNEMKKFMGIILLMGHTVKKSLKDYWSNDPLEEMPIFSKVMSRDRFMQILQFLHFNDNSLLNENSTRLHKIKPIQDYFLEKFKTVYKPDQHISIDEGVIPWRGRLCFKTYNPDKPNKYGLLVRMLCESRTGYITNFQIYSAEGKTLEHTIFSLLDPCLDVWHHLYQDNFYNSVYIAERLLTRKVRVCGTIRQNRGLPLELREKSKSLKKGETIYRRKGDILLQIWKDKREVRMISSIHDASMIVVDKKTRDGRDVIKPNCINDYNKYMKGVDRADQYLSYCGIMRKTRKWTKRAVLFLFNCALFNSLVTYKKLNRNKRISYSTFLKEVARIWITEQQINDSDFAETGTNIQPTRRTTRVDPEGRLSGNMKQHTLTQIVGTGKKRYPQKPCKVCSSHGKRSETRYVCHFCQVPLHKGECFTAYHTLKKY